MRTAGAIVATVDAPPLDLVSRPVAVGGIISPLRVGGLLPAESCAEQVLRKIASRVVCAAHHSPRPQLLAYLGMEREKLRNGHLPKFRQQRSPRLKTNRPLYAYKIEADAGTIDIAPMPF